MKTYRCPSRTWPDHDTPADVPTCEELALAEALRHRLELKLLSPADLHAERFGAQEFAWADAFAVD